MSSTPGEAVLVRIQRIDGQQVIDIPPEFDLGTDEVALEYDGKRIIMTARKPADGFSEGGADA